MFYTDEPLIRRRYRHFIWEFGIPAELWIQHSGMIERFIEKEKLPRIEPEQFYGALPARMADAGPAEISRRIPWPYPFPGGLRMPHVHFKGDIYALDRGQWKEFSAAIVDDFGKKLDRARNVSFETMMELSHVIDAIQ